MISLNTLLEAEGLDPKSVKLVRHRDTRHVATPFDLWRRNPNDLDIYQCFQRRAVFGNAEYIASFVVTPLDETLFVGVYSVLGRGVAADGELDPLSGESCGGLHKYSLEKTGILADYVGRLVIEWGPGYRSWVQRAGKKDKPIVEIRREFQPPPFPGFLDFRENLSRLAYVPSSWRETLSAVNRIYLLCCPTSGKQYVGAAYGQGGFWSRWEEYVRSGDGGNARMIDIPKADYQVSVLEVARSSATFEEIVGMEVRWKRKLLSREFGLNAN